MFGMMEAVLSFLRRQVGLRTDTADADGSLHAKVADAKESLGGVIGTLSSKLFIGVEERNVLGVLLSIVLN